MRGSGVTQAVMRLAWAWGQQRGKGWPDSEHSLKAEPTGFSGALDVRCENKEDLRIFHLRHWTDGVAGRWNGGELPVEQIWGKFGHLKSDVS